MIVNVGTTITRIDHVKPGSLIFNEGQTIAYVHTDTASVIAAPNSSAYPVQPASAIPWTGKEGILYGVDPTGGNPGIGVTLESGLPFPAPVNSGPNLVIPELHSPGFLSGNTGWAIRKDGSAEFNNVTIRNGQIVSGNALYYSGPPAAGNLIASDTVNGGTDSHGNQYLAGTSEYAPNSAAVQLINGQINFYTFTTQWVLTQSFVGFSINCQAADTFFIKFGALDAFDISNAIADFNVELNAAAGITVSGGTADKLVLSGGTATVSPVQITQAVTSTNSAAMLRLLLASGLTTQQAFLSGQVTGDTSARIALVLDPSGNPSIRFGPGPSAVDCILIRPSAHLLQLTNADYDIATVGRGLQIAEGTNARQGTATLVAGQATVANTSVTANTRIYLGAVTPAGSPGALFVSSVTVGTGFHITSSNGADTSTVSYFLVEKG